MILLSLVSIAFIVILLPWTASRRHPARDLSPEKVISHRGTEGAPVDAGTLFRLIGERLRQIRGTLRGSPSRIEVEMCALGYKACSDDATTLSRLIDEDLPRCGSLRRFKLKMYRWRTTKLLRQVDKALNHHTPRASTQKQS